jgi:outer membrane protein assembly factor BamB
MPGAELCCVEGKSGTVKWSKGNVAEWHAGLIGMGDGKVLFYDGKGAVRLLAANAERYEELASAEVGPSALINPAFADGRLYARDKTRVVCLQLPKP